MMRSGIYEALAYLKYRKPRPAIKSEFLSKKELPILYPTGCDSTRLFGRTISPWR